jgi:hypothetical protein
MQAGFDEVRKRLHTSDDAGNASTRAAMAVLNTLDLGK